MPAVGAGGNGGVGGGRRDDDQEELAADNAGSSIPCLDAVRMVDLNPGTFGRRPRLSRQVPYYCAHLSVPLRSAVAATSYGTNLLPASRVKPRQWLRNNTYRRQQQRSGVAEKKIGVDGYLLRRCICRLHDGFRLLTTTVRINKT